MHTAGGRRQSRLESVWVWLQANPLSLVLLKPLLLRNVSIPTETPAHVYTRVYIHLCTPIHTGALTPGESDHTALPRSPVMIALGRAVARIVDRTRLSHPPPHPEHFLPARDQRSADATSRLASPPRQCGLGLWPLCRKPSRPFLASASIPAPTGAAQPPSASVSCPPSTTGVAWPGDRVSQGLDKHGSWNKDAAPARLQAARMHTCGQQMRVRQDPP